MGRSVALLLVIAVIAVASLAAPGRAQPAQPDADIDMEGAPEEPPARRARHPRAESDPGPGSASTPPAQPTKDPKASRRWLLAAKQLVQKGDYYTRANRPDDAKAQYENALTAFQKSLDTGDDLETYLLLAELEDKLGKPDLAATHCRVVIKASTGVRPEVVKKATAKFDELSAKVGLVTVTVMPEGTAISIAGTERGTAPLAEPLVLMPGSYTFGFAAEGFQPKEVQIKVEAGSESERTIDLEAVKIIVEAPPHEAPGSAVQPVGAASPPRLPLYVGAGATVALLGTATITGILAIGQHGTYTANDATAGERADAKTNGERLALISDLTLLGSVAAAGFTAYWYVYKYRRAQRNPSNEQPATMRSVRARRDRSHLSKVELAPWVQPEANGLAIVGAF